MKILLAFLIASSSIFADTYSCQSWIGPDTTGYDLGSPVSVPCTQVQLYGFNEEPGGGAWMGVGGNTIHIFATAEFADSFHDQPYAVQGNWTLDRTFQLPTAAAGDSYQYELTSIFYVWGGGSGLEYIDNAYAYSSFGQFGGNLSSYHCYYNDCYHTGTVSASDLTAFQVQMGLEMFVQGSKHFGPPTGTLEYYAYYDLQLHRFSADGTPDPFTTAPEPASIALSMCGLAALGLVRRKTR